MVTETEKVNPVEPEKQDTQFKSYEEVYAEKPFHPEVTEKMELMAIMGDRVLLRDARIFKDWEGEYGVSSWCLMLIELPDTHDKFIVKGSGKALPRQVERALRDRKLPLWVTIKTHPEKGYFHLS